MLLNNSVIMIRIQITSLQLIMNRNVMVKSLPVLLKSLPVLLNSLPVVRSNI